MKLIQINHKFTLLNYKKTKHMKKFLMIVSSSLLLTNVIVGQEDSDFDKKMRFGLRVSGQPGWYASDDNFTSKSKTNFGYGFGLVTEFKLSKIIHFQTGIGGDFDRASIKYNNTRYDVTSPTNATAIRTQYVLDSKGDLVSANDGESIESFFGLNNTEKNKLYVLNERKIKSTYITIPLVLKMLTNEYNGLRYFGMFGGELGFRSSLKADDKVDYIDVVSGTPTYGLENKSVNINKDGLLVPVRFGINAGAGIEYRLSGSTSFFANVNYFRSFTNEMKSESRYNFTGATVDGSNKMTFANLKQNIFMNAIRINLGIMF